MRADEFSYEISNACERMTRAAMSWRDDLLAMSQALMHLGQCLMVGRKRRP